ncbi:actin cytoskeleton organization protein [Agrocybe pediades]|nr:actin cytoskeleton organization protein [Agrocybe pediades]
MSSALDRQIRPIYDALDTGSNKSAIVACNKLLKKHPKNDLIKALKALALIRSQKVEESLVLCDEVLETKPTDDAVLTALMHVLRGLGRHNDTVTMFEEAFKKQPSNEDLGSQTFFANVRANHWKSAHQIATRMFKQFHDQRYLYWSVISAVLQANDATTPSTMRPILYKLAHRLLTSSPTPSYVNPDRFYLHLTILLELELYEEADTLLDSDAGKSICATNLSCNELRREIWRRQGRAVQEAERAEKLIVEKKDRNWLEFLAVLDGVLPSSTDSQLVEGDVTQKLKHVEEVLSKVQEEDGLKDRSGPLALLELERRARIHGVAKDQTRMLTLLQNYFDKFGDKACCFEDLKPFLKTEDDTLGLFRASLESVPTDFTTVSQLIRLINSFKILRYTLTEADITVEKESERVATYAKYYFDALALGAGLPVTELQPADDLALLAGNALISLWQLTGDDKYLYDAVYLLEFALTKSKQSFLTRLILIRVYRLLGASSLALEHYRAMQVKQVQHDTLSHLILSRASAFSLASSGDLTLASECLESTQIYLSNSQETGDFVVRAFTAEKYSQIPEFIKFEERLENSLQRDTVKVEHLRMRLSHEAITSDLIDMELIELKFIFDRTRYDNRDFNILPDYQPRVSSGLNDQTLLFGKPEGDKWLSAFLKVYIRAFQAASDLDDTVEEKLLIGDRPKQTADSKLSLRERLLQKDEEELDSLTSEEATFLEYANALVNWIEPYYDYARPPPAVVLAEAAKQTQLKTGHPLKGVDINPVNGKKEQDPPAVTDAPEVVVKYFEAAKERFQASLSHSSPTQALHTATIIQEAFLLLVIETFRFTPTVVKLNKFGLLATQFKDLRTASHDVLKDISSSLKKRAEADGSSASKQADHASKALVPTIDRDFVFTNAKLVADSRRKVLESVAKGIDRLLTIYTA